MSARFTPHKRPEETPGFGLLHEDEQQELIELRSVVRNAIDNLSDMPVSEKWASVWVKRATQVLEEGR